MRHLLTLALFSSLPTFSFAHTASPFLLPEVFDSQADNVSFQSGITIEKFFVASRNFKTDYQLTTPEGKTETIKAAAELKKFNIAEANLSTDGTYRLRTQNATGTPNKYALIDGRWLRVRPQRPANANPMPQQSNKSEQKATPAPTNQPPRFIAEDQIPSNAKTAQTINSYLAESFVTKGKPSTLPAVSNKGLEFKFATHPNELFSGESLKALVLMDGKPVPNLEVDVFKGASSYQPNAKREQPHVKTNAKGEVEVKFNEAGIYLITTTYPEANTDNTKPPIAQAYTYSVTVEVTE
ncbi:DUF4198 domain-containing protein [Acinetobacter colistiniresistens]|uniref:DUF4198 domain-containing protein n=1 Tax=Acinetobacter colistiniresistens TaxID=280145 RepID=S3UCZ3_9GAMM|nr:DUF4198 domain-containing protein [Acinetobacter colistiniresistens]EPG37337.1 hypothetical protein F907_01306 [Acinetobacter colistiniresistens]TVT78416.1 DUF4198 domain-containing protein [Acinetobacter colistiniresistens]